MLAPGDYLVQPPPPVRPVPPASPRPAPTANEPTTPHAPAEAGEAEPRSFLLTLLRALGAIHT